MKHYITATGITMLIFLATSAMAKPTDRYEELTGEFDDFDAIEKSWERSDTPVPELPTEDGWVEIPMDSLPKTNVLSLDRNNIVIDKRDWVIRFWVEIK